MRFQSMQPTHIYNCNNNNDSNNNDDDDDNDNNTNDIDYNNEVLKSVYRH